MKHTKGPWIIQDTGFITDTDGNIVADRDGVSLPNAHLISASPELLASLNEFVEWFEIAHEESPPDISIGISKHAPTDDEIQMYERAKRALNKAKGKSK